VNPADTAPKKSISELLLAFQCHRGGQASRPTTTTLPERVSNGIRKKWKSLAKEFLNGKGSFRFDVPIPSEKYHVIIDTIQDIPGEGSDLYLFSTSKNEEHLTERLALVANLFEASGFWFRKGWVIFPNPDFVQGDEGEIESLFQVEDITPTRRQIDGAGERLRDVESAIQSDKVVSSSEGKHCKKLHCPQFESCQKKEPGHVSFLPRIGKKKDALEALGIKNIKDIPEDFKLSSNQEIVAQAYKGGVPVIDRDHILIFLEGVQYPVSFFDVESIASPIPIFPGTTSNQRIIFQFSLHVDSGEGDPVTHHEFLAKDRLDPRITFIESLLASLPKTGSVVVYHQAFEQGVLLELAKAFPKYSSRLMAIIPRLVDLETPFAKRWYCDHRFQGSSSLKKVYPVLSPGGNQYQDLQIRNGEHASSIFLGFLHGILSQEEYDGHREGLLEYCGLDTLSMIGILHCLRNAIKVPVISNGDRI